MIIAISGSVGSGKTSISNKLQEKLNFKIIHLNDIAKEFKLKEIKKLKTFDFDLDKLINFVEKIIIRNNKKKENLILESHFAHFLNPKLVDFLFIISRNQKELLKEYKKRDYNKEKISDNLEVENFNLCFLEATENGFKEKKDLFLIENKNLIDSIKEIYLQVGKDF